MPGRHHYRWIDSDDEETQQHQLEEDDDEEDEDEEDEEADLDAPLSRLRKSATYLDLSSGVD